MSTQTERATATRVTVTFSPDDERTADALDAESYRGYLRRTHSGPVSVGDEWEEFVSCGCGTTRDVTLRVDAVDGGNVIDETTTFEFQPQKS